MVFAVVTEFGTEVDETFKMRIKTSSPYFVPPGFGMYPLPKRASKGFTQS
jgi:hypothetical protein